MRAQRRQHRLERERQERLRLEVEMSAKLANAERKAAQELERNFASQLEMERQERLRLEEDMAEALAQAEQKVVRATSEAEAAREASDVRAVELAAAKGSRGQSGRRGDCSLVGCLGR